MQEFFDENGISVDLKAEKISVIGSIFFKIQELIPEICSMLEVSDEKQEILTKMWNIIFLFNRSQHTQQEKDDLAWEKVQPIVSEYRDEWVANDFHYLHLVKHYCEQFASHGNCLKFCCESVESMNHLIKMRIRDHTNYSHGENDHIGQVLGYFLNRLD